MNDEDDNAEVTVTLSKGQIKSLIWLMEDKVSAGVMALSQFAGMRAALAELKDAVK